MANFSKPARYIFMEIQKIDSNYYPEVRVCHCSRGTDAKPKISIIDDGMLKGGISSFEKLMMESLELRALYFSQHMCVYVHVHLNDFADIFRL